MEWEFVLFCSIVYIPGMDFDLIFAGCLGQYMCNVDSLLMCNCLEKWF